VKGLKWLLVGVLMVALSGCTPASEGTAVEKVEGGNESGSEAPVAKVGLVLTTGGLGDKNFNDMSYEGLVEAKEEFGIEFDYVEPKVISDYVSHFRMYAESGEYDLIIGIGNDQVESIVKLPVNFQTKSLRFIRIGRIKHSYVV
jgi:basic membrane protein A